MRLRYIKEPQVAFPSGPFLNQYYYIKLVLLRGEIHASTSQLEHRGINITFNWVPSHIGINGNELADSIALEARQLDSYNDPPPSISCFEEMLFKFKQNWKNSVYNSDKSSVQRYRQINPLLKPFKSTLNQRYGEVLMSRLRCTDTPNALLDVRLRVIDVAIVLVLLIIFWNVRVHLD